MDYIKNLDYFLNYISEKDEFTYSHDIYRDLKKMYSEKDLTLTVEKLHLDKYIDFKYAEFQTIDKVNPPYYCRINYHGLRFLERGGYKSERIRTIKAKFISTAKIVMITINAIIILIIAAAGVYVSYESKEKDETIKNKNKQIEILSAKVDSLTTTK
ncbi:MAG: hypothetical protein JZU53_04545 [Paludibacter sp.]|nr:hypothetical protein [Paludibacter sp.]